MSITSAGPRRKRRRGPGWAFVAPYALALVTFGLVPVVFAIVISFQVTPVVGASYVSLWKNFADVIADYRFPVSAGHVGLFLLLWLPPMLVVVFALALVMDAKRTRFAALTRFVTYLPGAITGSAAAILWIFMFSPTLSPAAFILKNFVGANGTFISNDNLALVLAFMAIAMGSGGWIVLVFGALTAISSDLIEAARLDGVNAWQMVWHLKLPLIKSYIAFILIVSFAGGFQVFAEPAVIASGSPGRVSTMWSINQVVFTYVTSESNFGRASALALILFVVCLAIAIVVLTRTKFYSIGEK